MPTYDDLNIGEKAQVIKSAVNNGITNLQQIGRVWDNFTNSISSEPKEGYLDPSSQCKAGQEAGTTECARWQNQTLRDYDYMISGNAWDLNGVDEVFNGYNVDAKPQTYDEQAVIDYNKAAAKNVYDNFDSKTLNPEETYVVNMFYGGSRYQPIAYEDGRDGLAGTHTGILSYNKNKEKWYVTHNIHNKISIDPFISIQNPKGAYGVTAIYSPRKDTFLNQVKTMLGFADGGQMETPEDNLYSTGGILYPFSFDKKLLPEVRY